MVGAMTLFVLNDALVKRVSEDLPAGQLICIRGVLASLLVWLVVSVGRHPVSIRQLTSRWVLGRAVVDATASLLYLIALFNMPLGNAMAIGMASPLFITLLAVWLLGERVDRLRWIAIAVGFGGVLLVVKPSAEGFNAWSLLALFATFLHGVRDLATRRIPAQVSSMLITLSTAFTVCVFAGVLSLFQGWRPVSLHSLMLLAVASVLLASGYLAVIASVRTGDLSTVAPFRYTGLLVGLVVGYLVWDEIPSLSSWMGIVLLIVAGLYLLRRERVERLASSS
jgi:drug/metabolite transporter (DMT)-like permease